MIIMKVCGILAGICTMGVLVPQVYRLAKLHSAAEIAISVLEAYGVGVVLVGGVVVPTPGRRPGSARRPAPLVVAGEPAPTPATHNATIPPERIQHTQLKESLRAVFAGDRDSTDTSVHECHGGPLVLEGAAEPNPRVRENGAHDPEKPR